MKKINLLLSAITILALLFTSCTKENIELNPETGETITLMASTESAPDTKTELGGDPMTKVHWKSGDAIAVFNEADGQKEYTLASIDSDDPTKATFTGDAVGGTAASAIYPYSEAMSKNSINMSATQTYASGNVKDGTMPMYAKLSDYTSPMSFKNLCGILKLQLMKAEDETGDVNVTQIEFTSTDDIAGQATITYNEGSPILSFTDSQSKTITLECSSYILDEEDKTSVPLADYSADGTGATVFYIVIPPTTANKFTIKVTTDDGKVMTKTTQANNANKIVRNQIKTMPAIPFVEDIYEVGDTYPKGATGADIQGVVFEISNGGANGKVISKDEANIAWGPVETDTYADDADGRVNMATIKVLDDDFSDYHAFEFADNKNPGTTYEAGDKGIWYLPSKDELVLFFTSGDDLTDPKALVNTTLETVSEATQLTDNYYWSSTEYVGVFAWSVGFGDGSTDNDYKGIGNRVRAILAF